MDEQRLGLDEVLLSSGSMMRMEPKYAIGHIYFFENIVVYGNPLELGKRKKSQLGEFMGIVKGLMPVDPYYVLYEWIRHRPGFLKRQAIKRQFKKLKMNRKQIRDFKKHQTKLCLEERK